MFQRHRLSIQSTSFPSSFSSTLMYVIAEVGGAPGSADRLPSHASAHIGAAGLCRKPLLPLTGYGLLSSGNFCSTCGVTCAFGPSSTCIPTYAIQLG